ncbi:terpenoid cyclases/Protein prenyltransferase [Meredithblackwellia eburnea MCA 4105]
MSASKKVVDEHEFLVRQHIMFAYRSARYLPTPYQAEDSNRLTLAYFCLSALSLLPGSAVSTAAPEGQSALDTMLKPQQREGFIEWVYQQQVAGGGFRGSDSLCGTGWGAAQLPPPTTSSSDFSPAHLIQSYTALLILGMLGDDFTRLDRAGLLRFLARCQGGDGSFLHFPGCEERGDPRSSFSAFAISSILNDWSGIDVRKGLDFVSSCKSPTGGFSIWPGLEAQGGFTCCAVSCFYLASKLDSLPQSEDTLRWLVARQVPPPPPTPESEDSDAEEDNEDLDIPNKPCAGFQGRIGKDTDACYSFWCSAALQLLKPEEELYDPELDKNWLLSCQNPTFGGIAREPGAPPDVYHTYLALACLSLHGQPGLFPLDPAWNVSTAVAVRMREVLHKKALV